MKVSVSKMVKATFLLAAVLTALPAMAQTITFTISADGSGTIGTTPFTDQLITFTQVTNTSAILPCSGEPYPCAPKVDTNTVTIGGMAPVMLTGGSFFFDNGGNAAGIATAPGSVYLAELDSSLGSYTLTTNFGPTSFGICCSADSGVPTSGGAFSITSWGADATFTAVVGSPTPEPATFGLMLTGAGMLGLMMAMRKR